MNLRSLSCACVLALIVLLLYFQLSRWFALLSTASHSHANDASHVSNAPINLLWNPSFVVGRRHWHAFKSAMRATIEHVGELDPVDQRDVHNVLLFDTTQEISTEVHGVFQSVVFRSDLFAEPGDYVLELAAKWRTRDLHGGYLGLEISMDVLFDDNTHMLDQSLTTLVPDAEPAAPDSTRWRGGDPRWMRGCRRLLLSRSAPLRVPKSAVVYILFDATSGRATVSDVSLRVMRADAAPPLCPFDGADFDDRRPDTVATSGEPRSTSESPTDVVDWRLTTVRRVRLLRALDDRGADWNSTQRLDVTAVTLASLDRFDRVVVFAQLWRGPFAAVLYAPNETIAEQIATQWQAVSDFLTLEIVVPVVKVPFPINELRNRAIDLVRTSHLIVLDADFVPSPGMRTRVRSHLHTVAHNASAVHGFDGAPESPTRPFYFALVAPAFESLVYSATDAASFSREQLLLRWQEENDPKPAHMFASAAQGPTNFTHWVDADQLYAIPYASHFEPYYVVPTESSERYDARFRGYGADKSEHCYAQERLRHAQMVVMPDTWLIHIDHGRAAWKAEQAMILPRVWKNWYARLMEVDRAVREHERVPSDWLTLERTLYFHDWTKMPDWRAPPDRCLIDVGLGLEGAEDFALSWPVLLYVILFAVPLFNTVVECTTEWAQ